MSSRFPLMPVRCGVRSLFVLYLSLLLLVPGLCAADNGSSKIKSARSGSVARLKRELEKRKFGTKRSIFSEYDAEKMELQVSCGAKKGSKKISGIYRLVKRARVKRSKPFQALAAGAPPQIEKIKNCGEPERCLDLVILGDGFKANEMAKFRRTVSDIITVLFQTTPFREYSSYFNVYRIDLESAESGVDCNGRNNALGSYLLCGVSGGPYLVVDSNRAYSVAALVPGVDKYLVVANATKGRANASVGGMYASTTLPLAGHTTVHELGHSIGGLADEYQEGSSSAPYEGTDPRQPNITKYKLEELRQNQAKWAPWLSEPHHGAFEGVGSYSRGLYRPTVSSVMRTLGDIFNAPGRESLIVNFYKFADPFESTPAPIVDYENPIDADQNFSVRSLFSSTNSGFITQWYLDGVPIEGATGSSFNPESNLRDTRTHELELRISDSTPWVRDEYRQDMAKRFKWAVASRTSRPLKITRDLIPRMVIPPGGTLGLYVETSGGAYEGIDFEWFKDGKSVAKSGVVKRYQDGVYFENLKASDTGNYYLVATSGEYQARSTTQFVEVRQSKMYTLSGRVTDASGSGIGGALIAGIVDATGNWPSTKADGTYSLTTREGYYELSAIKGGYEFNPSLIGLDLAADTVLNFTEKSDPARHVLKGKITGEDGVPLQGVAITSNSVLGSVISDANGDFAFPAGAEGTQYELIPSLDGYSFSPSIYSGTLHADSTVNFSGTVISSQINYTLSGRVLLSGGQSGVTGVSVSGGALGAPTTDGEGRFTFRNVPAGTAYRLRFSKQGYTFSPHELTGTLNANADLSVVASQVQTTVYHSLSGRVTLSGTNTGVAGLTVHAGSSIGQSTTNAQGRFTFTGIQAGTSYRVQVSGIGYTITPSERTGVVDSDITINFSAVRESDVTLECYGALVDYLYSTIPHAVPGASRATLAAALKNGTTSVAEVADDLLASARFVNHSVPAIRAYQLLGGNSTRPPDLDGFEYHRERLSGGATITSVVKAIIESSEFRARYPVLSPQAFVVLMYANGLGRLPTFEEVDYWRSELTAGRSREEVAARIGIYSEESALKQAFTVFAQALSLTLTSETPSVAEAATIAELLRASHLTRLDAITAFIYSKGFPHRCGAMGLGRLSSFDSDLDGTLSPTERAQWFESQRRPIAQWQNPIDPFDVNNDGAVSNLDLLIIVNELNRAGPRELPASESPNRYYDVDGDGWITESDADAVRGQLS